MSKKLTVQPAHKPAAVAPAPFEVPAGQMLVDAEQYQQLLETVPLIIQQKNDAVAAANTYQADLSTAIRCLSDLGPVLGLSGGDVSVMQLTKIFSNMGKLREQMAPLLEIIVKYTVSAATGELQHG